MDREALPHILGWAVGLATTFAALATAASYLGPGYDFHLGSLSRGKLLLAAIAIGGPLVLGGIVGFVVFLIVDAGVSRAEIARLKALNQTAQAQQERDAQVQRIRDEENRLSEEIERRKRIDRRSAELRARIESVSTPEDARRLEDGLVSELAILGYGLDDAVTSDGRTVLHVAAAAGNLLAVDAIAARGPRSFPRSQAGRTFVDEAAPDLREEIAAAFVSGYQRLVDGLLGSEQVADLGRKALVNSLVRTAIERAQQGDKGPVLDPTLLTAQIKAAGS